MIDKTALLSRFSAASPVYHHRAHFQKRVAEKLAIIIAENVRFQASSEAPRILELGCGTGFLTRCLVTIFPNANILATDLSLAMLRKAEHNLSDKNNQVGFHVMDAEKPDIDGPFDLICSSLMFQWLPAPARSLRRLTRLLAHGGKIIISTISQGSLQEWQLACEEAGCESALIPFLTVKELEDIWPLSGRGKWSLEPYRERFASGPDFLHSIRSIGASLPKKDSTRLTSKQLRHTMAYFEKLGSFVTWVVGIGIFQKFSDQGVFVTGTGTDVGKTYAAACLVQAWKGVYWKPLQTGTTEGNSDLATVLRLTGIEKCRVVPHAIELREALSPESAAQIENRPISRSQLALPNIAQDMPLVIEGAGGVMVPITKHYFVIDYIDDLGLPVIIVGKGGLGAVNDMLLTVEALRRRKIPIAGIILNGSILADNKEVIERYSKIKILAVLPEVERPSRSSVTDIAAILPSFHVVRKAVIG